MADPRGGVAGTKAEEATASGRRGESDKSVVAVIVPTACSARVAGWLARARRGPELRECFHLMLGHAACPRSAFDFGFKNLTGMDRMYRINTDLKLDLKSQTCPSCPSLYYSRHSFTLREQTAVVVREVGAMRAS